MRGSGRFSAEETQQSQVNFAQCHGTGRYQVPIEQNRAFPALALLGLWVCFGVLSAGAGTCASTWDYSCLRRELGAFASRGKAGKLEVML